MNRTQIRYALAGFWGMYAGIAIGYVVTKKRFERIADEEIQSVKDRYDRKTEALFSANEKLMQSKMPSAVYVHNDGLASDELTEKIEKAVKRDSGLAAWRDDDDREEVEDLTDQYRAETGLAVDSRLSPDDRMLESVEHDEELVSVDPQVGPRDRYPDTDPEDTSRPYTISVDEWHDELPEYDKITLTYYEGDDVLTDEKDTVVRKVDAVIGDESITKFGDRSDDSDIVYVRNEKMQVDYEVCLNHKSFQEVVLGIKNRKVSRGTRFPDDGE